MTDRDVSHPADRLIHDLIAHPRAATGEEIRFISERIASAPFNTDMQRIPARDRGFAGQGITLKAFADSLTLHFVQHAMIERQWAANTTVDEYVRSIRRATVNAQARIALYRQWQVRHIAVVTVPTDTILDSEQRGPGTLPNLLVVYLADRGILISGYQFSTIEKISIPKDALWLK